MSSQPDGLDGARRPSALRIAFVVGAFPSWSETFVLDQITGLLDRGHDVTVLAREAGAPGPQHGDVARLLERRLLVGAPASRWRRSVAAAAAVLRSPTRVRALNGWRFGPEATSLRLVLAAAALAGRGDYDIVHCHFGGNGLLAVALRELGALRGRITTTFHGHDMTAFLRTRGERAYDRLFAAGDLMLPISEHWRQRLIGLGCDPRKVHVHRMGIDAKRLPFQERRLGPDGEVRLLTLARLTEKKGVAYALEAISTLRGRLPQLRYQVVGDGPLRASLQALTAAKGLDRQVEFLGAQPREVVATLLARAHVLLAPSVTAADGDQEGIPVALMEAMACGLPVLATRHSGIPELVEHGESGLLVAERDVDALAAGIVQLVQQPSVWPAMGRRGRTIIERDFALDRWNDRLVKSFEQLCATGQP